MKKNKLRIGFTIGDINGIGPEIMIKTFSDKRLFDICTPVLYATPAIMGYYKKVLRKDQFNYQTVSAHQDVKEKMVNIFKSWDDDVKINMGNYDEKLDKFTIASLQKAVEDYQQFNLEGLVTLPLNKSSFRILENKYEGHTEFLEAADENAESLMMMVSRTVKVALVTAHVPVKDVASILNEEIIIRKATILYESLRRDFGIDKPKIGVLALNPHAGDNGLIGKEEQEIIIPALNKLKDKGILAMGPYPADGLFGSGKYMHFDAILAMYHDQGLAPFKLISNSEDGGVNFTAGLKMVRTSPDHGTAYDIVGKKVAKTDSLIQSIFLAVDVVHNRLAFDQRHENPVKKNARGKQERNPKIV